MGDIVIAVVTVGLVATVGGNDEVIVLAFVLPSGHPKWRRFVTENPSHRR